jgi:hypothetical protein
MLPIAVNGQSTFRWSTNLDDTIALQFCFGPTKLPGTSVTIPDTVTGRPVTQLGPNSFGTMNSFITNVVIPDSVYEIDGQAFWGCRYMSSITIGTGVTNLYNYSFSDIGNGVSLSTYPAPDRVSFYFNGNAPALGVYSTGGVLEPDLTVFDRDPKATVYYLPGTTGWSDTLGGLPTALWLPQMQPIAKSPGTTQMAFNIFWAKGKTVVIESCSDLLNPAWLPVATNTLTTGTWRFSDQNWTTSACGFYRVRAQ